MRFWIGIRKGVLIIHFFRWHLAFGGGFRGNYGMWYDDCDLVGEHTYCKCGVEV